jgi:low temperature requirement protein LtrA
MTHPGTSPDLPVHPYGRKATWFELFFDLVFVVAVAQLSGEAPIEFRLPEGRAHAALDC